MRFEEFANVVVEKIRDYLPETFAEASVELKTVMKNNDLKLTGIIIRIEESNICPTIYLEQYFKAYEAGEEMDKILADIADVRVKNDVKDSFDVDWIMDFARVKDVIIPRLVNREQNAEVLARRPYSTVADLAVTYHIMLGGNMSLSTPVTDDFVNVWGVNTEELHETAVQNMARLTPGTLSGISAIMNSLSGGETDVLDPADEFVFVITNALRWYGAAAILDEAFMRNVMERVGDDFYVLPSSVHELIIVNRTIATRTKEMKNMVRTVNSSVVEPEERLSDQIYRYNKNGLSVYQM